MGSMSKAGSCLSDFFGMGVIQGALYHEQNTKYIPQQLSLSEGGDNATGASLLDVSESSLESLIANNLMNNFSFGCPHITQSLVQRQIHWELFQCLILYTSQRYQNLGLTPPPNV